MPSGSHGGSPGSHYSGGASHRSSGGGPRDIRPGRSGRYVRPLGHFIYIGRGRRALVPKKYSALTAIYSVAFVLAFICLMPAIAFMVSGCSTIKNIEVDYAYYNQMIESAYSHPERLITGKVTDKFYNRDCGKWYFTYELPLTSGSGVLKGYTYSIYTSQQISQFEINQEILIAVNAVPVTKNTDSIPVVCRNSPITDDGEWIAANTTKTISIVLFSASGGLMLISIGLYIFVAAKAKEENEAEKAAKQSVSGSSSALNIENDTANSDASVNFSQPETSADAPSTHSYDHTNLDDAGYPQSEEEYKRCPNCGGEVSTTQEYCSICGAKLTKVKRRKR